MGLGLDLFIVEGFGIILRSTTLGNNTLEKWSGQPRDRATHYTHKRQTTLGEIRTRNPSKRAAVDPRLRSRGHRNRQKWWLFLIIRRTLAFRSILVFSSILRLGLPSALSTPSFNLNWKNVEEWAEESWDRCQHGLRHCQVEDWIFCLDSQVTYVTYTDYHRLSSLIAVLLGTVFSPHALGDILMADNYLLYFWKLWKLWVSLRR